MLRKDFFSISCIENNLFLPPEIRNINLSFTQKIHNMNFSFEQGSSFGNNFFLSFMESYVSFNHSRRPP